MEKHERSTWRERTSLFQKVEIEEESIKFITSMAYMNYVYFAQKGGISFM